MDFSSLTYIDYLVIAIVGLSTLFAFMRGFISSFLSLTGWIASIYLAYTLYPFAKPLIEEKVNSPIIALGIGHAALLIGFLIIFGILNFVVSTAVKGLTAGIFDRALGAGFGVVRGIIIVAFLFLMISTSISIFSGANQMQTPKNDILPKWIVEAKTFPLIKESGDTLISFIPESFYTNMQNIYTDLTQKTMDERFVENSVQKLKKSLNPDIVKSIDHKLEEEALTKSTEELRYERLKELIGAYEHTKTTKDVSGKSLLSSSDLDRLHNILKTKQNELQKNVSKHNALTDYVETLDE